MKYLLTYLDSLIVTKLEKYTFLFYALFASLLINIYKAGKIDNTIIFGIIAVPFLIIVLINIFRELFGHHSLFLFIFGLIHIIYSLLILPYAFFLHNPLHYIFSDTYRWVVSGLLLIYMSNKKGENISKYIYWLLYANSVANILILLFFIAGIMLQGKYYRIGGNIQPLYYWIANILKQEKKDRKKTLFFLVSGICSLLIYIFSLTRISIILMLVFMLYLFIVYSIGEKGIIKNKAKIFLKLLVYISLVLFIIYRLYSTPFNLLISRFSGILESGSVIQRKIEIDSILTEINNKISLYGNQILILGAGVGALYYFKGGSGFPSDMRHHAHFSPLLIFYQRGIFGLVLALIYWLLHGYLLLIYLRPRELKRIDSLYISVLINIMINFIQFFTFYTIYSSPIETAIIFSAFWNAKFSNSSNSRHHDR